MLPSGPYIKLWSTSISGRTGWTASTQSTAEMTSERINMRHNCVFHGLKLVNTAIDRDFSETHAHYSEKVEIPEANLTLQAHYEMQALDASRTRLSFNVNWLGAKLPVENKKNMMAGQATNFELFKHLCETDPA